MMHLTGVRPVRTIVCLGAHPDDIEIGCGGTLLGIGAGLDAAHFVIASGTPLRVAEAEESAHRLLGKHCAVEVRSGGFDDGFLPYEARDVKTFLRDALGGLAPDIVFAPSRYDLHQDHRFIGELALQLFRDHLILGYEIPKYDGDLVPPNFYVPLAAETMSAKVEHLMGTFASQQDKAWYRPEVFTSLAAVRGVECHAPDGYAEAFHAGKVVFE